MYRDHDEEEQVGMQSEEPEHELLSEDFAPLTEDEPQHGEESADGEDIPEEYEPLPEGDSDGNVGDYDESEEAFEPLPEKDPDGNDGDYDESEEVFDDQKPDAMFEGLSEPEGAAADETQAADASGAVPGDSAEEAGSEEQLTDTIEFEAAAQAAETAAEPAAEPAESEDAADNDDMAYFDVPETAEGAGEGAVPAQGRAAAFGKRIAAGAGRCRDTFLSWKRWQQILLIVLVCIVLLVGIAYAYFHSKYILMDISDGVYSSSEELKEDESLEEQQESLLESLESGELEEAEVVESTAEVYETEEIVNILLIGTDDRTTSFSDNARGDTCILLSINRSTGKINLISFERATGVKIPSGDYEGQWDWLTHTFWYGGPDMMMTVIRDNFKVDVTKYVRVNIRTFMKLVDAVGGVDIDMTEAEVDNINHPEGTFTADHIKSLGVADEVQQDLVVGVNHLNGATAMLYARLRSIDSDWYRVVRQRNVILAAVENLKNLSLTEVDNLLNEVLPLVQTNLTEADIASLLTDVGLFLEMDYGSITFPLQNTYGLMDGMSGRKVLAVDFETNAQELQNLISGEVEADELAAKYENLEDELEDYSYKDSEVYQENYADAESIAGKSYRSSSSSSSSAAASTAQTADTSAGEDDLTSELIGSVSSYADTSAGENTEDSAADTAEEETASSADASSLGVVESISTDESTGLVTIIYYNEVTGVRTAVVTNLTDGSTAVATDADTAQTSEEVSTADEVSTAEDTSLTTVTEDTTEDIVTGNAAAEAYAAAQAAASGE